MRIKVNFRGSEKLYNGSIQHYVNGFIHSVLGENNKYHDTFSNYAVSSLQGGKLVEGGISYKDGAHLWISSNDENFSNDIMMGLISGGKYTVCDLEVSNIEIVDFSTHKDYDIIRTISPILLKDKEKVVTFQDDGFVELLLKKSKEKLLQNNMKKKDVDTLVFEPFHFENAKLKFVKVRKIVNKSSQVMLLVRGNQLVRQKLYEMGLGKSTGCGFGSVEIISK